MDKHTDLCLRFLMGEASEQEVAALNAWIAESPDHAERFALLAAQEASMSATVANVCAPAGASHDVLAELASLEASAGEAQPVDLTDELKRRGLAAKRKARREAMRSRQQAAQARPGNEPIVVPRPLVWLGLAAVIGLVATLAVYFDRSGPTATPPPSASIGTSDPLPNLADPVAELTGGFQAAWLSERPDTEGLMRPGRYTLTHGWAEVRTTYGVDLVLEAPVTFSLGEDNGLELVRGQLVADVSERAIGFAVQTPGGRVVDFGTTFGVAVDMRGATSAHVFAGEIEVISGRAGEGASVRLVEDQSATVSRDGEARRSAAVPEQFVRSMPATPYQAAVLASRPMCYWRGPIDAATARISDRGWLASHGLAHNDVSDTGTALDFLVSDAAVVTVPYRGELNLVSGFTVEAWVWVDRVSDWTQRIISMRDGDEGGWGFGLQADPSDPSHQSGVLLFSFYGVTDVLGTDRIPLGQWVHVAATVDGQGRVALYVNGQRSGGEDVFEPARLEAAAGGKPTREGVPVRIGNGGHPDGVAGAGPDGRPQPLHGMLNDLVIFDRPLSANEVRQHAQHGPPPQ